jgi:hypothetical protein
MSYLGFPRIHFSGEFQADPSTVNNDPSHFNDVTFTPNDQLYGDGETNGWWNPNGTAYWRLRNCRVQSLYYSDGSYCDASVIDPIIGLPIQGARDRVSAKLVDLDPEQQMVSEIWGLQIRLGDFGQPNSFQSEFEAAPFSDIWVRYPAGKPDAFFSAVYQSVLTGIEWGPKITSRFLQELAENGNYPATLSIKFTVDGYDDDHTSPTFTWGRMVGAIGPYLAEEPKHFVNGRLLRTMPKSSMNYAPCYIDTDRKLLFVDFGNSLPTTAAGGPLQDIGPLQMAILPAKGKPVLLGPINYLYRGFNEIYAGIQSFPLTPKQLALAQKAPLAVIHPNGSGTPDVYLSENQTGAFARTDQFVYRMDANTSQTVTLYATKFGRPQPGQAFKLVFDNSGVQGQQTQGLIPGPSAGTPESALTFPSPVTTDVNGQVRFELKGGSLDNPRRYIDGQVYGVAYQWQGILPDDYNANPTNLISVLLWDDYPVEGPPTWLKDVQPIFQQYANLYPVMKSIVDLSSYMSVISRLDILKLVFNLDPHDPNYMPVTRDLSGPKRAMIQTWLQNPLYMRIMNVEELKDALQLAIELEHSTIPPYLTALYSLKPGRNREVARIIRSIVVEEMLHMSLACNLLNAIGGSPQINTPRFVPGYPTHMPGGLRPELTVSLKKCSVEHIRDVFMSIEEPQETIDPELSHEEVAAIPHSQHSLTIGWFYTYIASAFKTLSADQNIFVGDPNLQLKEWPHPGELIVVKDLTSALDAINEIVEQGEGATPIDPNDPEGELAHYYKFAEIVHGRRLVQESNGYSYTGDKIAFDESGVWPMIDNPRTQTLDPNSQARLLSEEFNQAYANVLNALHTTFNGEPENIQTAVGLMFSLTLLAEHLMQIPTGTGSDVNAGPSFQYPAAKTT